MCWELDSSIAKDLMKDTKHTRGFVVIRISFFGIISFDFQVDLPMLVNHQNLFAFKKIGNARISEVPGQDNPPF